MRADTPDRSGEIIDTRYRLVRKVGEGGMGEVYEAEHVFIKKRLALKLLRTDANVTDDAAERLYREANATSSIGHPNIVKIEDFGLTADGAVFLAMEWLDGITLEQLMKRGPVAVDLAVNLMAQTCAGLAAAHREGVVHRDMKPANILLLGDSEAGYTVKLVDFGIAKLMYTSSGPDLTDKGTFVGTPHYVSPEQALGETIDRRSDLYAVGVILYELLTGELPFDTDGFVGVLEQHVSRAPIPPAQRNDRAVAPALDALVLRCLEKDPNSRFTNATELQFALDAVAKTLASTIMPAADVSARPARTSWAYIVIIVLLLAGGAVLFRWQQGRAAESKNTATTPTDAAITQSVDASVIVVVPDRQDAGVPPPSRTEAQYQGRGKHFSFRASISPSPVAASQQFSLTLRLFEPSTALAKQLAKGTTKLTADFVRAQRHKTYATARRVLLDDGKIASPIGVTLPKNGRYHVILRLSRKGRWLARAQFSICVGADRAGDPGLYRRICGN